MTTPEATVQRQLDAYNAKNVDTLVAAYAVDAEQFEHPAKLLARGTAEIRERFKTRFLEPNLHAHLVKRIVAGNIVIDHELVTRTFPEGPGNVELVAIYEVQNEKIAKVWFIPGKKTLEI
jgi:putative hydrolase of HD superfamily